jgi:hypothetical protein
MSKPTRRTFLRSTLQTVGTLAVMDRAAQAHARNAAPRLRKNINDLTATSPEVVALNKAVKLMKENVLPDGTAMAANDGRRWLNQSLIHGTPSTFTNCQHESWFFFPWHRIYLYHFEEIVRMLSGDETFALPYWDWSRQRTLPALFWGAANPLDCPSRPGETNSGRQPTRMPPMDATTRIDDERFDRYFSPTRISTWLALNDFEQFGGGEVANVGDSSFAGRIEGGPHNSGHTWIGLKPSPTPQTPRGDMTLGSSPTDPIFWLHHCNVDRLWARWAQLHPTGHPANAAWRATTFDHFFGRDGQPVPAAARISVGKSIDTTELGYTYVASGPMLVNVNAGATSQVFPALAVRSMSTNAEVASFEAKTAPEFIETVNKLVADPEQARVTTSIRLVISGIKPPERLDTSYDVYLNCKKLKPDTPITDASYVGSCTFFHGVAHEGKGHAPRNGVSFAFNLDRKFTQLYADKNFDEKEPLEVAVIARVPSDTGEGPAKNVAIEKISPEQVKIEVVKKLV